MPVKSNDTSLKTLLEGVGSGKYQLPEFQRGWVWSVGKIRKLIESISSEYPMGAVMAFEQGGSVKFKYRLFESVKTIYASVAPDFLILDGQQRLTSLYQVFMSKDSVKTSDDKTKEEILRYFYLDINKCLDLTEDRYEAIVPVNKNRQQLADIGRTITLDLSTREKEYEQMMYPLNIVFDTQEASMWLLGLNQYYVTNNPSQLQTVISQFTQFQTNVLNKIISYTLPVIQVDKNTSNEAVCQIFENVNTGGVPLNVFELVTAKFAMGQGNILPINLRDHWEAIKHRFNQRKDTILKEIDNSNFLTAVTLLVTYSQSQQGANITARCKKKDVLNLSLADYLKYKNDIIEGVEAAADFMIEQGVYESRDIPYTSQIIPLAAIFAYDKKNRNLLSQANNYQKLAQWYWCGVFGELYGGANEGRFANDIIGFFEWLAGHGTPDTVNRSNFNATRLLSMQTRNSSAYKGVMAIILQTTPCDFQSGKKMDVASYLGQKKDIHHIFPQEYCTRQRLPIEKWNSVVNKTPIYASTNRSIGGDAPSVYIPVLNKKCSPAVVQTSIESHHINYNYLSQDMFDEYFIDRAKRILNLIERVTGKPCFGRNTPETIKAFGSAL